MYGLACLKECKNVTYQEIGELLGVSKQTVNNWERRGSLPKINVEKYKDELARFYNIPEKYKNYLDEDLNPLQIVEFKIVLNNPDATKEEVTKELALFQINSKLKNMNLETL